ncbi:MAG: hypothetical protein RJQ09_15865 [Cyclobacteriaceae bacterium]
MRSAPVAFILFFTSCGIDPIVDSYEIISKRNLGEELGIEIGNYGGLFVTDDDKIIAINERLDEQQSSQLTLIGISENHPPMISELSVDGFDIDLNTGSTKRFETTYLGLSPFSAFQNTLLTIDGNLNISQSSIPEEAIPYPLNSALKHLTNNSLYLGRENRLIKIDFNGDRQLEVDLSSVIQVLQIKEGVDGFFVLLMEGGFTQLAHLSTSGEIQWTVTLNGINNDVPDLTKATDIFVSEFNTVSVIGENEEGGLMIAVYDLRGEFIFRRFLGDFFLTQFRDFVYPPDGTFIMALAGDERVGDASFSVIKLDHRGELSWTGNYRVGSLVNDLEIENINQNDLAVLTENGFLYQLEAMLN